MIARLLLFTLMLLLAGCDNVVALLADPKVAQREADAKAIGGACRFGLRSIEDCYLLNEKASKSAVFIGWKDMDQYMRENKVEGIVAKIEKPAPPPPPPPPPEEVVEDDSKSKGSGKKTASH
jgi:hypothetical protein